MKDFFKRILRAGILICALPSVAKDYANKHILQTVTFILFLLVFFYCSFSLIDSGLEIVDLQTAFSTGNTRKTTDWIVIHHTAGTQNDKINDIAKIHFGKNQWSTIAYHYFINADGEVFRLKPENEIAPHSYHYNDNSIAICLSGNFNNYDVPKAQYKSLLKLVKKLLKEYNLNEDKILRHCDLGGNNTECPGRHFDLETFKSDL